MITIRMLICGSHCSLCFGGGPVVVMVVTRLGALAKKYREDS